MDSGRTEGCHRPFEAARLRPCRHDTDLHKRVANAIKEGFIKRFDMHVSSREGNQDLSMWMRDVEELVRKIMRDKRFKGHQNFTFEACLQDDGQRVFGGEASDISEMRPPRSPDISRFSPQIARIFPGEALNPFFGAQAEGFSKFCSR